jgi:SAM-dependent methyltransferase
MPASDSNIRFSDRVADYVRTRPGYPTAVLDILCTESGLNPATIVADIGSGTGLSAELFLRNGNTVFGVEPNREMREAAESLLASYSNFHSVAGSAENTTLPDASADLVVAGQAFHWFDVSRARTEFRRILRPDGFVVLMWNTRRLDTTPFLRAYEELLLKFGTDYREVVHTNVDHAALSAFFGPGGFRSFKLDNVQIFDRDGTRGRLRSSSYTPAPGQSNYEPMMKELDRIFDEFNDGGKVRFEYDTEIYVGQL